MRHAKHGSVLDVLTLALEHSSLSVVQLTAGECTSSTHPCAPRFRSGAMGGDQPSKHTLPHSAPTRSTFLPYLTGRVGDVQAVCLCVLRADASRARAQV